MIQLSGRFSYFLHQTSTLNYTFFLTVECHHFEVNGVVACEEGLATSGKGSPWQNHLLH